MIFCLGDFRFFFVLVCNVPGIVIGAGNTTVNKVEEIMPSRSIYVSWGRVISKSKIYNMSDGDKF